MGDYERLLIVCAYQERPHASGRDGGGRAGARRRRLHKADLVVVGNKGLASFAGRLLGSVPQQVSWRSRTDVLIVHTT